jgi:hypothetical protein
MPKTKYVHKRFGSASLEIIKKANEIIADYDAQGFELTLRQLYYQFAARGPPQCDCSASATENRSR